MAATLVTPALGIENGYQIWYPNRCKFCVCFEDADLIADAGTHAELTLQLLVNAPDGDYFILAGQTFTFRTVPSLDFDVLIGANANATIVNIATAIRTLRVINPSDYYVNTFSSKVTILAIGLSTGSLAYDIGTSTLSVFLNIAGVLPTLIATDYRVYAEVLFRLTTAVIYPIQIERDITIVPIIMESDVVMEWTCEMCLPIDAFLKSRTTNHVPDPTVIPSPSYVIWYDWMVDFKLRFAKHYGGDTYAYTESDWYTSTNAICPDSGDYEAYSQYIPHNEGELFMLVKRNGLEYCRDTTPFFYLAVRDGEEIFTSVEWNDGGGWLGAASAFFTPGKDAILEVRPSALYPANFVGQVRFWVENTSHNEITEVISFKLVGGTCCTKAIYFLNRFGKYELIQIGDDTKTGIEIDVSRYTTCDTCDDAAGDIEYAVQFSEMHLGWTGRLRLNDTEDMSFIRDFFTSPEVWLLNEFNEMERIIIDRGTVGIRENASQISVRFQVKYSKRKRHL